MKKLLMSGSNENDVCLNKLLTYYFICFHRNMEQLSIYPDLKAIQTDANQFKHCLFKVEGFFVIVFFKIFSDLFVSPDK